MKETFTKISIFLITLTLSIQFVHSQNYEWVKQMGGLNSDEGHSVTVDVSGNVYTTGYFQGTADFDPGPGTYNLTSVGFTDIFICKQDSTGNLLWAKQIGGTNSNEGYSIAIDSSGNVYTTGFFYGTADFDPGPGIFYLTSTGSYDIFICKLDSNGDFVWAKHMGGSFGDNRGNSIVIDNSGNVYTTGHFQGTADFDPGTGIYNLNSAGSYDIFICKLDSNGNFIWAKKIGGSVSDMAESIALDGSGNIYTAGTFGGNVDFDPGPATFYISNLGAPSFFISKLDSAGNFIWAKQIGGVSTSGIYCWEIAIDNEKNVYATGEFDGTADFDPGVSTYNLTSSGNTWDIFINKLDSAGNFIWAKRMGSSFGCDGRSITIDTSNNIYTTGRFDGTVDFDPGAGTYYLTGTNSTFINKLTSAGNFVWAKGMFGSSTNYGNSICVNSSGEIFTTGAFDGPTDFDPGAGTANFTSSGSYDIFIHKMSQCINTTSTDVITACDSYTWIDGNTYTVSNNTATYILNNTNGCDSLVLLDLTIKSVSDITTTLNGVTLSSNNNNASYQWLDCNNNYSIISGEINQSFTPSINGNYAVQLTENGCIDTSVCVSILTIGIIENGFGNKLLVSPNPTIGDFSIDLGSVYKSAEISISDINGKLIRSELSENKQVINMSLREPTGIYLLMIQAGDKTAVIRLIKD